MPALAPTVQAFFVSRLGRQTRRQPTHRRLLPPRLPVLLAYAETQTGKRPAKLDLGDLDAVLVSGFLVTSNIRGSSVASRNTRLAALHSFFRFASYRHPERAETIQQVSLSPARRPSAFPDASSLAPRWTRSRRA